MIHKEKEKHKGHIKYSLKEPLQTFLGGGILSLGLLHSPATTFLIFEQLCVHTLPTLYKFAEYQYVIIQQQTPFTC